MAGESQRRERLAAPTKEEVKAANAGNLAPRGILKRALDTAKRHPVITAGAAVSVIAGGGFAAVEAYQGNIPGIHESLPKGSSFDNGVGKGTISETQTTNSKKEVFDNSAAKGVISERNTIQMTREEYEKIAPPVIDRENLKEIHGEINLPPEAVAVDPAGKKTRKFTIEQNTSVNTLISVKTPEGNVRELTYAKIINPGDVKELSSFPVCNVLLGLDGEIQPGDEFPAPISGIVYHHLGEKLKDGTVISGAYFIEGEYLDAKTGERFRVEASINSGSKTITKPLIENMPYLEDSMEGTPWRDWRDAVKKMPKVTVRQGENLLKFISKPPRESIAWGGTKSQMVASFNYYGDIDENDFFNTLGGENCTNPTVNGKAIVIK